MIKIIKASEFTVEELIETADKLIELVTGEHLTVMEQCVLECYWHKKTHREIFKLVKHLRPRRNRYKKKKTNTPEGYEYFAHHIAPNLTKKLAKAMREKVTKRTIIETLRRQHEKSIQAKLINDLINDLIDDPTIRERPLIERFILIIVKRPLIERFIYFLADTTLNNKRVIFSDFEIEVLRQLMTGKTYEKIASGIKRGSCKDKQCRSNGECVCTHIAETIGKDVAGKAYKKISKILNKKVAKSNFQDIVKQWQKKQENFMWNVIQIAILQTESLTSVENSTANMQRSNTCALITLFLLVLVNANASDASADKSTASRG